MRDIVPISVCPVGATLGEGPVWVGRDAALWFVDIKERRVHRFRVDEQQLDTWCAPAQVGWVLPAADGGMVAGLQTGIHRFDPASGRFDWLHDPELHLPGNRLNDAVIDADGAIWFGSMDDAEDEATGRVYRFAGGVAHDSGLDPVAITNGPAIAPDGGTLYPVDTLGRKIWAVERRGDGTLAPPRLFAEIEERAGHPDGASIDAEGHVWIGLFGGWGVRRYDPDGRLERTVRFPVANVTKVAFGGDGLRTAYATTARMGLDAAALTLQPLAGNVFAFDPGVAGVPCPLAALE